MKFFIKAERVGYSVIYTDEDGKYFRFFSGTLAWRNHNPGNIKNGLFSKRHNQIGIRYRNLAIFPDDELGHANPY